jgi:hypothetical protein
MAEAAESAELPEEFSVSFNFDLFTPGCKEEILAVIVVEILAERWNICCFLGSFLREISHHRLEQEQVCLLTYSHLTPAPNRWPQGDSGYSYNSG